MASKVAIFPKAMSKVITTSQDFSKKYDCVLDGRNITSEVLPNADVKFFLTASAECRAKRRLEDDLKKGIKTTYEAVLSSLAERDYRDTHRQFSAMVVVPDAVVVDNTNMTIDETIEYCAKIVENKLKSKGQN
jgi:cytidylate kinase